MKIAEPRQRPKGEIDVSAFSDIAFLLIIFFIVATAFISNRGDELDVPAAESTKQEQKQEPLAISLGTDSILYGKGAKEVDFEQLRELLASEKFAKQKPDDRLVMVQCSKTVPYDRYFKVVVAVSQAGGTLVLMDEGESEAAKKLP